VRELIVEDGAVRGATVERDGRLVRGQQPSWVISLRGFPHDVARRKKMFPHAPTGNETFFARACRQHRRWIAIGGSGRRRVEDSFPMRRLGAGIHTRRKDGSKADAHFIDAPNPRDRGDPRGVRFANEGNSYHDFVQR